MACALFVTLCGCMFQTGFIETDQGIIFKDEQGKQAYGMKEIEGDIYCFDSDGYMVHGFHDEDGERYYFDEEGKMVSGKQKIGSHMYLFDKEGKMQKGLHEVDGKKYFLQEDGKMIVDQQIPYENHTYVKFNEAGEFVDIVPNIDFLQKEIESIASKYSGNISIYFKDLQSDASFYINPQVYYPCCMIKVSALATVMEQIELGNIAYDPHAFYIENMITISDNTSFNRMMKAIGQGDGPRGVSMVNEFCRRQGLNDTAAHHGLRPGADYFTDHAGENQSSAHDLGILFEKIYRNELAGSDFMLDLLSKCEDDDELMQGLEEGTRFANKTGCAYALYHDGGIVFGPERDYILVVFQDGVVNHHAMMKEISSYIYEYERAF